jgi:SHAQKYF class myb-like DNA-binding protein
MENLTPIQSSRMLQTADHSFHDGYCSSASSSSSSASSSTHVENAGTGVWTKEEHARFLEAIKIYANGPWKVVAAFVGTRTVRQTMTHAQKYRQKAARRLRGLRTKQALMRMHFGHRVSEESLVQERLRSLGMLQRRRFHPSVTTSTPAAEAIPSTSLAPVSVASIKTEPTDDQAHKPSAMQSPSWTPVDLPPAVDAFAVDVDDQSLLDELMDGPSLDECVSVIMDLLF